MGANTTPSRL